jgi:hypothetical protein
MNSSPSFRSNLRYSEWVMIVGVSLGFLLDVADDGQGFDPKLPHLGWDCKASKNESNY